MKVQMGPFLLSNMGFSFGRADLTSLTSAVYDVEFYDEPKAKQRG
jgi:hypothetical protein